MITKLLNKLKLFTHSQYSYLEKNYENVIQQYKDMRSKYEIAADLNQKLPYNFDSLMSLYNDKQLNCMYYKLINTARKDPKKRYLLERWQKRVENAKDTLNERESKGNIQGEGG